MAVGDSAAPGHAADNGAVAACRRNAARYDVDAADRTAAREHAYGRCSHLAVGYVDVDILEDEILHFASVDYAEQTDGAVGVVAHGDGEVAYGVAFTVERTLERRSYRCAAKAHADAYGCPFEVVEVEVGVECYGVALESGAAVDEPDETGKLLGVVDGYGFGIVVDHRRLAVARPCALSEFAVESGFHLDVYVGLLCQEVTRYVCAVVALYGYRREVVRPGHFRAVLVEERHCEVCEELLGACGSEHIVEREMSFGVDNGSRIGISHGALCVGELTCEEVYGGGNRFELDLHLLGFESRSCGLHLCEVEGLDVELAEGTLQFDVYGLRLVGYYLSRSEECVACVVISDVVARERNVREVGGVVVEVRVDVGARLVGPEDEVEGLAGDQTRRERCREVLYGSYLTFAVEFAVEVDLHDTAVDGRTVAGSTGFGHLSGQRRRYGDVYVSGYGVK